MDKEDGAARGSACNFFRVSSSCVSFRIVPLAVVSCGKSVVMFVLIKAFGAPACVVVGIGLSIDDKAMLHCAIWNGLLFVSLCFWSLPRCSPH